MTQTLEGGWHRAYDRELRRLIRERLMIHIATSAFAAQVGAELKGLLERPAEASAGTEF